MPLTTIWEKPEDIDFLCELLIKIYDMTANAKDEMLRKSSEKYLTKYSNELAELTLAVIDGKIGSNNINLSDAVKPNINMPNNLIGKTCQLLAKLFKTTLALKDNEKRTKVSVLLADTLNIYLDLIIALIDNSEIEPNIINEKLRDIEIWLSDLLKTN